jgi:hypothetical protein
MDSKTRRTLEMAARALEFSRSHPDQGSAYVAALSRLEAIVARASELVIQQRDGFSEVRAATAQKRDLRRTMRQSQLLHLSRVAEAAGKERPDLEQKFLLTPAATPYLAFRAAARGISAEAQNEKELLIQHGLLEPVLESLSHALDQFDQAVERGTAGRRAHVTARAELEAIADEANQVVRLMDGMNRFRLATEPESIAGWESASNTFGPVKAGGKAVDAAPVAKAAVDTAAVEPSPNAVKGKAADDHAA